ncbi:hypothetical protein C8Q75DRAFT_803940 [Abortiporus biennis]|nr:hypothetical protein C8Q75DRAFT_803940 [Abortiporus biennis]
MSIASELYVDQLGHLKYGYPMWRPESMDMENVMVGDVGIITDGQFKHIFSAPRSSSHMLNAGMPADKFEQLKFDNDSLEWKEKFIPEGVYSSKSLRVDLRNVPVPQEGDSPSPIRVDFTCSGDNGAMLALPTHADKCHIKQNRSRLFVDYIKAHHSTWFGMSRKIFVLNIEPDDIILVRGWIKTTAFTTAAITHKRYSSIFYPGDTFSSVNRFRFTPTSSQIIQFRIGPNRSAEPVLRYAETDPDFGTDIQEEEDDNYFSKTYEDTMEPVPPDDPTLYPYPEVPTLRDQTIFLSFYKLKRRGILPEKIVAYAEDQDGPPPPPPDERNVCPASSTNDLCGHNLKGDLGVSKWKPLDELLSYLLRHSDAALAIACDEDVYAVCKGHPWPDDFKECYEQISPPVYVDEDKVATLYRDEYLPKAVQQKDICTVSDNLMSRDAIISNFSPSTPSPHAIDVYIMFCLQNILVSQSSLSRTSHQLAYHQYLPLLRSGSTHPFYCPTSTLSSTHSRMSTSH